jgi:hypothetical protein
MPSVRRKRTLLHHKQHKTKPEIEAAIKEEHIAPVANKKQKREEKRRAFLEKFGISTSRLDAHNEPVLSKSALKRKKKQDSLLPLREIITALPDETVLEDADNDNDVKDPVDLAVEEEPKQQSKRVKSQKGRKWALLKEREQMKQVMKNQMFRSDPIKSLCTHIELTASSK